MQKEDIISTQQRQRQKFENCDSSSKVTCFHLNKELKDEIEGQSMEMTPMMTP